VLTVHTTVSFAKITDPAGGRNLRRQGSGTLNLGISGTNNTGAFVRNDSGPGSLNLYGVGTIGEIVYNTLTGGGEIGVGDTLNVSTHLATAGTGILIANGGAQLQPNVTLSVDLNGTTAGSGYDQLQVAYRSPSNSNTASLNGATLNVRLGFVPPVGTVFEIIRRNSTAAAITGAFNSAAPTSTPTPTATSTPTRTPTRTPQPPVVFRLWLPFVMRP